MQQVKSKPRRGHGDELKAQVVAACAEPGASVLAVALSFGLNANLVRQWQRGRGYRGVEVMNSKVIPQDPVGRFVALALPARPSGITSTVAAVPAEAIRLEFKRGTLVASVTWPTSAADECAAFLRELFR